MGRDKLKGGDFCEEWADLIASGKTIDDIQTSNMPSMEVAMCLDDAIAKGKIEPTPRLQDDLLDQSKGYVFVNTGDLLSATQKEGFTTAFVVLGNAEIDIDISMAYVLCKMFPGDQKGVPHEHVEVLIQYPEVFTNIDLSPGELMSGGTFPAIALLTHAGVKVETIVDIIGKMKLNGCDADRIPGMVEDVEVQRLVESFGKNSDYRSAFQSLLG